MTIYLLEKSLIEIHVFVKLTVKRPLFQCVLRKRKTIILVRFSRFVSNSQLFFIVYYY